MQPLFSIITITFNAANELPATLASVKAQTFTDYEHLIVDGKSKDNTVELARNSGIANMRITSEPDRGLYDAMNKGIRQATGKYLIFLNAGDAFHAPETLKQIAETITEDMLDPDGIQQVLSDSDDDNEDMLKEFDPNNHSDDDDSDPFGQFSDSISSCFRTDESGDEQAAEDGSQTPGKKRKSRIPIHKKHKKAKNDDSDLSSLSEATDAENPEDADLMEALEDEIFGQPNVPDDAPKDVFGFPSTKPAKLPKYKTPKNMNHLWNVVRKKYINISKKGHAAYPACRERPEAIKKLIARQRVVFEYIYVTRRIRALQRVNYQLRSLPDVGYTAIFRIREGKRLTLALRAAQRRIRILRQATAVDEFGRSAYTIESEIEKQRIRMLVNLSKKKKEVSDLSAQIAELQRQIGDYDRRIQLMTQKKSEYTKYFKKSSSNRKESKSARITTKITLDSDQPKADNENNQHEGRESSIVDESHPNEQDGESIPKLSFGGSPEGGKTLLSNSQRIPAIQTPTPPNEPRQGSKSPRSRIPVPKNHFDSV